MEHLYIFWFVLAFMLLVAEMAIGSFYLLVISVGMGAAGVMAMLDFSLPLQIIVASIIGALGVAYLRKRKSSSSSKTDGNNLDIGQQVHIDQWIDSNTARVSYRGSSWEAELEDMDTGTEMEGPGEITRTKPFFIKGMRGNVLLLTNRRPR